MENRPNIYEYSDYRSFLKEDFQRSRDRNPAWSLGAWAKKLDDRSVASLSMILSGKRGPGTGLIESLSSYYKFSEEESRYFAGLIRLEKVKNDPVLKSLIYKDLASLTPSGTFQKISYETFNLISSWFYYFLIELIGMPQFKNDVDWIQSVCLYPLSKTEIRQALTALIKLELVKEGEDGKLSRSGVQIETPSDITSDAIQKFNASMIEHAKKSMSITDVSLREIRGVTLNISKKRILESKKFIRSFEDRFIELFEETETPDDVYQLNIQLFPLSHVEKERK